MSDYEEELDMDSKEKLDQSFDRVMEAFDRWDAAADRFERKLRMMPFVVVGTFLISTMLVDYFL
jgi:hypothetical protein